MNTAMPSASEAPTEDRMRGVDLSSENSLICRRRQWFAKLHLTMARQRDGKTRFTHCEHAGPLRVQRLFHPDDSGSAHCYLLHPPGGVATGDELEIRATLSSGKALITTPSAGRFYTVEGCPDGQIQRVELDVREGHLQWLPQETILFAGARAQLDTKVTLAPDTRLSFWDVITLGKPACGELFTEGSLDQTLRIEREDRSVFCDRIQLQAGDRLHRSRMGLNGCSTIGTCVLTAEAPESLLDDWLSETTADSDGSYSVTQRGELLIARYLGDDAQRCRHYFARLLERVAAGCYNEAFTIPRIWHT